jgi:hypothetical protein
MQLTSEMLDFLSSPVLLLVGAADEHRRPAMGRALGVIARAADEVDVVLSRWQWPEVVRNIASSGRLALTAARASDYVTYQLKGPAIVRRADAEELACAERYWTAITETLSGDNVPAYIVAQWAPNRDMVAARLLVTEAYVQTPGPLAGTSL